MTYNNLIENEQILDQVAAKYDILEIMDLLDWETEDIVQAIAPHIIENLELFDELDI